MMPRMLDLFAGRLGWSKAFLARGWEVLAVDLAKPPEFPYTERFQFDQSDVMDLPKEWVYGNFDFICASPPCEQFSVHGMKHFHPNPKYPEMGIKLFNHTREICAASGVPYVIENVRAAQQFVGKAVHHCGPFYLWGTGVPPILPQGIIKGFETFTGRLSKNGRMRSFGRYSGHGSRGKEDGARFAEIPVELANWVGEYAENLIGANVI